jgi:hypothetical protein
MEIAAGIVLAVCVFLTVVLLVGLFVWAALKDGQEDRRVSCRAASARSGTSRRDRR